jgi:hypothetical protein
MKDSATLVSQTKSDEIVSSSDTRNLLENPQLQQSLPADFIIVRERPIDDVAPEDLLRVFEGKYNSNSGGWKLYVAIGIILAISFGGGIWFLLKKKPFLFKSISNSSDQSVVVVPAVKLPVPVMTDQKSVEQVLPSFIPQSGADSSFSSQNPGWERYVDKTSEYRLYRDAGRIKALQVLGIKAHEISEQKMKSILIELLGDGEYREKSSELKHGYQVSQATVNQKTDLLIYRKNKTIRAFVVSLD